MAVHKTGREISPAKDIEESYVAIDTAFHGAIESSLLASSIDFCLRVWLVKFKVKFKHLFLPKNNFILLAIESLGDVANLPIKIQSKYKIKSFRSHIIKIIAD